MQLKENVLFDRERYRLLRLLGRGGFSEVWLAEDTKTSIQVALKVYAPGQGLDDDGVKLFSQEFSVVFNFNHGNLLRPSHFDICERMPYLVSPFCMRGSTLKLAGKMSEEEAWRFLHDVASGLSCLHDCEPPVIHQDIKPDNILIDDSGKFMITDFGISIRARSAMQKSVLQQHTSGGTVAYMAPERFDKNSEPVKASDVWALGATLYELLTGTVPFGEYGGLLLKNGAEIPYIQTSHSPSLKKIVEHCLQKETWDRITAQDIVATTEQYLKGDSPKIDEPKFCRKCGKEIPQGCVFCRHCGAKQK
jgi:serine/threonine protein kinase